MRHEKFKGKWSVWILRSDRGNFEMSVIRSDYEKGFHNWGFEEVGAKLVLFEFFNGSIDDDPLFKLPKYFAMAEEFAQKIANELNAEEGIPE